MAELFIDNLNNEEAPIMQIAGHYTPAITVQRAAHRWFAGVLRLRVTSAKQHEKGRTQVRPFCMANAQLDRDRRR